MALTISFSLTYSFLFTIFWPVFSSVITFFWMATSFLMTSNNFKIVPDKQSNTLQHNIPCTCCWFFACNPSFGLHKIEIYFYYIVYFVWIFFVQIYLVPIYFARNIFCLNIFCPIYILSDIYIVLIYFRRYIFAEYIFAEYNMSCLHSVHV